MYPDLYQLMLKEEKNPKTKTPHIRKKQSWRGYKPFRLRLYTDLQLLGTERPFSWGQMVCFLTKVEFLAPLPEEACSAN